MEVTLELDPRKNEAKSLLDFLQNLSFVKVNTNNGKPLYNAATEKAISDAKKGINITKMTLEEFRKELY